MPTDPERQRRVRRTALLLGAIALAIYLGYIVVTIVRASH